MLWTALLLPPCASQTASSAPPAHDALRAVAVWALQFTPRVAIAEDSVVMEVAASTRLFGGKRALRDRVVAQAAELGVVQVAWATTSLAAQALARCGIENGLRKPLEEMLDALPMACLSAVRPHATTLAQTGCKTLGDVRALPRGGLSRRFDKALLQALDQAYGRAPEVHVWEILPDAFDARLELPSGWNTRRRSCKAPGGCWCRCAAGSPPATPASRGSACAGATTPCAPRTRAKAED